MNDEEKGPAIGSFRVDAGERFEPSPTDPESAVMACAGAVGLGEHFALLQVICVAYTTRSYCLYGRLTITRT